MAVKTRIQLRRDTAANWTSANPVLAEGEVGYVTSGDNARYFKIGDGTTAWNSLEFQNITGANGPTGPTGATGLGYSGVTSTTSNTLGTGSKTFTVASTGAFILGSRVRVVNSSSNYLEGTITALTANTSITVSVDVAVGSGTLTSWTFSIAGLVGATGATGATGAAGKGYDSLTSTTSVAISSGSKTLNLASTGALGVGTRVRVANSVTPANFLEGAITALTVDTSITVNVDNVGGSGTFTSWIISVAGGLGTQGPSGVVAVTSPITNSGTSTNATIGIQDATTSQKGAVQLTDSVSSTSATTAATPKNVKAAYDLAAAAIPTGTRLPAAYNYSTTSGGTITPGWLITLAGSSAPTQRPDGSSLVTGDIWVSW
jgi:hypothetical protein